MNIKLSDHFNYGRLLRFTFPSVIMMLFTSIYCIVDGFFVSNFAGKTDFAAVNFISPLLIFLSSFGFMLGSGGSALIGKLLGEKQKKHANCVFSMLVAISVLLGLFLAAIGISLSKHVATMLGAEDDMLELSVQYARIVLGGLPFFMLQIEFQSFFILAEKPKLGLLVTILSGCSNMLLDAILVGFFHGGVTGAAVASVASQLLAAVIAIVYFTRPNSSLLHLCRFRFRANELWKACSNGISEMMSNIAMAVIALLFNIQLLRFIGENGVAAYGVLMYVNFLFLSCFIGYSIGVAPIISYHFGAENHKELNNLLRKSLAIIGIASLVMLIIGETQAETISAVFSGNDQEFQTLTVHAFTIFSLSFLFCGIPLFGSSFFTALNDGLTSALISFLHTLVFELLAILIMPIIWGINGIWWSVVAAEVAAVILTIIFLWIKRKKFHYA